jgi:hypothetical protein
MESEKKLSATDCSLRLTMLPMACSSNADACLTSRPLLLALLYPAHKRLS